jgi:hypothetical protein
MAYTQQDYSYMGGVDPQTEEELKRREEERLRLEQEQRLQNLQQQSLQPIMPVAPMELPPMPEVSEGVQVAGTQPVPGMFPQQNQPVKPTMPDETQAETERLRRQEALAQQTELLKAQMQQSRQMVPPSQRPEPQQQMPQPSMYGMPTGQGGQGLQMPQGMQPSPANQPMIGQEPSMPMVQPTNVAIDRYKMLQDEPKLLLNFANDKNEPEWLRERARNRATDLLVNNREESKAQEAIKNMDPNQLAQALREKTTGGSWTKAIIYGMLGMEQSQAAEAAKLGIGKETVMQGADGTPYMVKVAANGTPIEGYNGITGAKLTANELVTAQAGTAAMKGATTHTGKMQDMTTGEVYYERTTPQGIQLVDTNGKRYTGSSANLRPFGIGSDIRTINQVQVNKLTNEFIAKPSEAAARTLMEAAAKADPGDGSEIARVQQLIRTLPMPGGGGTTIGAPAPSAPAPVAPAMPGNVPRTNVPQAAPVAPAPAPAPAARPAPTAAATGGAGARRPGESFDAYNQRMAIAKSQSEANIQEKKELNVAEKKPPAEAKGKIEAKDINNQNYANSTYGLIKPLADEIRQSTGSGIGTSVDKLAGMVGVGTKGAQAIAKLDVLGYQLSSNVPRFEGAQSDADVKLYQQAAGDLANSSKPVSVRLAALQAITQVLKKYDKAGTNDWTFGETQQSNTTSSGNKFKRVQ